MRLRRATPGLPRCVSAVAVTSFLILAGGAAQGAHARAAAASDAVNAYFSGEASVTYTNGAAFDETYASFWETATVPLLDSAGTIDVNEPGLVDDVSGGAYEWSYNARTKCTATYELAQELHPETNT